MEWPAKSPSQSTQIQTELLWERMEPKVWKRDVSSQQHKSLPMVENIDWLYNNNVSNN